MKAGWKTNTLEDCLERFRVPAKIQRKQFRDAGAFPIVSQEADFVNGYWNKSEDVCVLNRPVVIFGDHTQVLKYVDFDFVVGADGVKVLAPKPFIDAKYLYYFVMANRAPSLGYARHYRHVKDLAVSYPDQEEQQRIVAVLDEAFEGLARAHAYADTNLQNARELFPAILTASFTRTDANWSEKTLEELCEKITDGTHQTPKYFDDGYIFLSSKNVTSGKIDWENIKYIDEAQHLAMQKRLSPQIGDVLLAKNGTTGVAAIVDRDVIFDIYVSLALLRSKGEILPEFLLYFTNSSLAKDQFNKRLKGSGVPNLHLQEIRQVRMPYPNNIELQEEMVQLFGRQLKECEAAIASYEAKIKDIDDLRYSLLQKAFAGELTE